MTGIRGAAVIAGAFEHPQRKIAGKSAPQLMAEVARGALADAGLALEDVDGYFCSGDSPGMGVLSMADYLGLDNLRYGDDTESGGASYLSHVGHAAAAILAGKCHVALVSMAGAPSSGLRHRFPQAPEDDFEQSYGLSPVSLYALAAQRHMYEFGTTSAQLAAVKVAASLHAQHNPNARLREVVTVADVLASPMISDPLHRLDCCVTTDGGGALVVVSLEVARTLPRTGVKVLGHGEAFKHTNNGLTDVTFTGAVWSGPRALEEAGVTVRDVDYASIYDSFTITVLMLLEDLGFCEKGQGGTFVGDGAAIAPGGSLPVNSDGGGLCNNQPNSRGGMARTVEAVRQLRGETHPAVQVPDCEIALVQGIGKAIGSRSFSSTLILGREDS